MLKYKISKTALQYPEGKYAITYRHKIEVEKAIYGDFVTLIEFNDLTAISIYKTFLKISSNSNTYKDLDELLSDKSIDSQIIETIIFNLNEFKNL